MEKIISLVRSALLLLLLALLQVHTLYASTNVENFQQVIDEMTLEHKVGQLFIFGYSGTSLNPKLKRFLKTTNPGGIIAFKRNIKKPHQIARLNHNLQMLSLKQTQQPLFIMVDQEGGVVTRIKTKPVPPSALSMGLTNEPKLAYKAGDETGKILRSLKFNMNLAPVVDISNPHIKNFIGHRSFGKDPRRVTEMAEAFSRGLQNSFVIPTLKHFPGHGGLVRDSHKSLPQKMTTLQQMMKTDLVPFRRFAALDLPSSVMVAHVAFPKIDPSGLPSTFSKKMIQDILIDYIGYKGLVITDDIEMKGADSAGDIGQRAVKAIGAGADMVMVAWSRKRQKRALRAVIAAVKSGHLSMERINRSVLKILKVKSSLFPPEAEPVLKQAQLNKKLRNDIKRLKLVTNNITEKNLKTSLKKYPKLVNELTGNKRLMVFSSDYRFYSTLRASTKNRLKYVPMRPRKKTPIKALMKPENQLGIYYVSGTGTARRLQKLDKKTRSKLIVVNTTHPGMIRSHRDYKAVLDIHSRNYQVGQLLGKALTNRNNSAPRQPANK